MKRAYQQPTMDILRILTHGMIAQSGGEGIQVTNTGYQESTGDETFFHQTDN